MTKDQDETKAGHTADKLTHDQAVIELQCAIDWLKEGDLTDRLHSRSLTDVAALITQLTTERDAAVKDNLRFQYLMQQMQFNGSRVILNGLVTLAAYGSLEEITDALDAAIANTGSET